MIGGVRSGVRRNVAMLDQQCESHSPSMIFREGDMVRFVDVLGRRGSGVVISNAYESTEFVNVEGKAEDGRALRFMVRVKDITLGTSGA